MTTFVENWGPGSQWRVPISPIAVKTGFKWTVPDYFDVDTRGIAFASFFLPPAKLGAGSFYLGALLTVRAGHCGAKIPIGYTSPRMCL
jgi:hypothetical protein